MTFRDGDNESGTDEEHDTEQSRPSSQASNSSLAPSSTATSVTLLNEDIILQRLSQLAEERFVSPLVFEAAMQDYPTCFRLLREGVDCDMIDPNGKSLAHVAAATVNIPLIHALASSKRIWCSCNEGKIPWDYAAANNHLEFIRYLTESESFRGFTDDRKIAILEQAMEFSQLRNHDRVTNYLSTKRKTVQKTQNLRLLQKAVFDNDIKTVQKLVKNSISVFAAIDIVSARGQQDLLMILLRGIESDSDRIEGARSAYLRSLGAGKQEICKLLILLGEVELEFGFIEATKYKNSTLR